MSKSSQPAGAAAAGLAAVLERLDRLMLTKGTMLERVLYLRMTSKPVLLRPFVEGLGPPQVEAAAGEFAKRLEYSDIMRASKEVDRRMSSISGGQVNRFMLNEEVLQLLLSKGTPPLGQAFCEAEFREVLEELDIVAAFTSAEYAEASRKYAPQS
jgi:hypothetical protein